MQIIETPIFSRRVAELLSEDEYRMLQLKLRHSPEIGQVIVGTGGARKVRCGAWGSGKSRGARVIYYYAAADGVIYMLMVYAKNEQSTLTSSQKKRPSQHHRRPCRLTGLAARPLRSELMGMRDELFEELMESIRQAVAIRRGEMEPSRVFRPDEIDVAVLRERFGLSQPRFAAMLGISVGTLRNWEQGRRRPEGPAQVLLRIAARNPEVVLAAAAGAVVEVTPEDSARVGENG